MEEDKNFQKRKTKIGESNYLNKNCWLVKNLNYAPYQRCQYCDFKFRNCLFLHYQTISVFLIILFIGIFLLIEGKISPLVIITIFVFIIVYGYFFNESTGKIVKANFAQQKAMEALKELTGKLEEKVNEQTKDLREKSRYLQELLEIKSDFLRVVNHQLNTPLSVIKCCFSMINDGSYSSDKALSIIEKAVERINSIMTDFWSAYELEGERMKMEPQKTDIGKIIDRLVVEKQKLQVARERKLKISVEKPKWQIPFVWCDDKKIAHVVSNLLDNAIFYTQQGSIVVYYELLENNYLKINIKDTGSGIADEDKDKIFQKFSRGKHATDLCPDGSGLGLFIAKKIVEGNGGEISFLSQGINKGTTFSFTLPIYKD